MYGWVGKYCEWISPAGKLALNSEHKASPTVYRARGLGEKILADEIDLT